MHLARTQNALATAATAVALCFGAGLASAAETQLLWGDTHLHTSYSFDAYLNTNYTADPDTAYRYAKGLPVVNPGHRGRVKIDTPLDFLVVADHAVMLGGMRHIVEKGIPTEGMGLYDQGRAWLAQRWLRGVVADDEGMSAFSSFLPEPMSVEEAAATPLQPGIPGAEAMARTSWQETIAITDSHNEPGTFTSFIGWEWSSIPAGANMHRVVFTPNGADVAGQFQPFSTADSAYPEDLWNWLDETSKATGAEFVAIPHNSNISKGYMFSETSLRSEPYTAEIARTRMEWEPVAEITQFKGDSETHPTLSPEDEFADFETYTHYIQQNAPEYAPSRGDYVRSGMLTGLEIENQIGVNPFAVGVIGSTDAHTGLASAEEDNFGGKFPRDTTPEGKTAGWRTSADGIGPNGWSMSASGLAAVWAEENTRESIFAAFQRREVYGTTGPRIAVRFFGGWGFDENAANAVDLADVGYTGGVPMGGDLTGAPEGQAPKFLVRATKDPASGNLDRVQIVKGWLNANGNAQEQVYDVVWSDGRTIGADGKLPAVGSTVDITTGQYENSIGAPELSAVWEDPDFDAGQNAFYYARVLEIPTPRHSLFDAIALNIPVEETGQPATIQERAYSSAIWYKP
jgi:Protein of unknown function (DUF3604)